MQVNLELLATAMLARARRDGKLDDWIALAIDFMKRQDAALKDARDGLREQLGTSTRLEEARKENERLQEEYRNCAEQRNRASDMCEELIAERKQLHAERIVQREILDAAFKALVAQAPSTALEILRGVAEQIAPSAPAEQT